MATARPEMLVKKRRAFDIDPKSVQAARGFAGEILGDVAGTDADHVEAVVLVVSELVTNALRYGAAGRDNVWLDIEIYEKWTIVGVDDRESQIYASRHDPDDTLRLSGRGREIVEFISARTWWTRRKHSKTAFAAILRTGVTPDAQDLALLDQLERGTGSSPPMAVEEQPPPTAPRRSPPYAPAARPEIAADAGDELVRPDSFGSGPA